MNTKTVKLKAEILHTQKPQTVKLNAEKHYTETAKLCSMQKLQTARFNPEIHHSQILQTAGLNAEELLVQLGAFISLILYPSNLNLAIIV